MNTKPSPAARASRIGLLAACTALATAVGCQTVPPNKAGAGDRHRHIPGIEAEHVTSTTAAQALEKLRDGNIRWATGRAATPALVESRSLERVRKTGTEGQHPIAAVLTCADSRTPPEVFLDQGIGDIFVVRVAGNVTDTMGLASLEYGVDHLGIPLIVVMGHTQCGAVDAAVKASKPASGGGNGASGGATDSHASDAEIGNLGSLVNAILPAVAASHAPGEKPTLDAAIVANVRQTMAQLSSRSPVLAREIKSGDVRVVGAVYNVTTGAIDWLPSE